MLSKEIVKRRDQLLSKERGTVFKDPGGRVNVCLVYPNLYHVGMSNLGFQGIYGLINDRDDALCERAFLPDNETIKEMVRTGSPLVSLESLRPLRSFHIVAFSVSFENDYPSIIRILRLAMIPPLRDERDERDPLLVLGGVCATFNPEPLADIFDIIFIGEADSSIGELIEAVKNQQSRKSVTTELISKKGFYFPGLYHVKYNDDGTIRERKALDGAPLVIKKKRETRLTGQIRHRIITPETEFSSMALVEAMRGCPWSCRFCVTGYIYNPPRRKPPHAIRDEIEAEKGDAKKIGLLGPSLSDYPEIGRIVSEEEAEFSITSLRANPRTLELLRLLKSARSVSIAPEAGTERLRRVINKKISEEDILSVSEGILKEGIPVLRLYFMIGLPFETDHDIEGLIELSLKIRSLTRKGTVTLSLSTFVPKPFTPFQWHPMAEERTIKARLKRIKEALKHTKGMRVLHDVVKYSLLQGVFARGDRRISRSLIDMEHPSRWVSYLQRHDLEPDFYIYRERAYEETLPWDFIDADCKKEFLYKEYEEARRIAVHNSGR